MIGGFTLHDRGRSPGAARQLSLSLCTPKVSRVIAKAQASEAFYHLESQVVGRHEKRKTAITKTGYRIGDLISVSGKDRYQYELR